MAIAVAARVSAPVPGSEVPQSAQTLAVVLVGALLGSRLGALTLAAYVLVGALGLPVFSDGGAGWAHLVGPTGGYLAGFVMAAWAVGIAADRRLVSRVGPALGVMLSGHVVILGLGWAWLATSRGAAAAFAGGVAPFVTGGIVKSTVAAAVVMGVAWRASLRPSDASAPR